MASSYTIGAHFESFVQELIASGSYASASEVIGDGLRLLEERQQLREAKLRALRRNIEDGLSSGQPEPMDMAAIKADARARRKSATRAA